jgi:Rrf2 family transcriptional regulator, iron-sulfur cluster assembly transcription factor
MKFTALEEYGLRCILRLAQKELDARRSSRGAGGDPAPREVMASMSLGEIAAGEGLTEQYAGKIFRILQKASLVASVRGRKGGYRLAKPPESITAAETLDALGGRLFDGEVCGRYTGDRHLCVHSTDCAIRSLWTEIQGMIDRVLLRTTLSDLISTEHAMSLRVKSYMEETRPAGDSPGLVTLGVFTPKSEARGDYEGLAGNDK